MKQWLKHSTSLFFVLFILFVPFQFTESTLHLELTRFLFLKPVLLLKSTFGFSGIEGIPFSSDSATLFFLLLLLSALSLVLGLCIKILKIPFRKAYRVCKTILTYFLLFVLLKYGFDKIFMLQFYPPEPNILYSTFGNMTKDILYWSVLGTSKFYVTALGILEIGIAGLLLFKKTRDIGLLLCLGVFLNILLVNIGFHISVKILSGILLIATLFLLAPKFKSLYHFFFLGKQATLTDNSARLIHNKAMYVAAKTFLIGLFLLQILYPVVFPDISTKSDLLQNFQKAYKVESMVVENDTVYRSETPVKRIFFHQSSYLIFQVRNDEMKDYYIEKITPEKIYLLDYNLNAYNVHYTKNEDNNLLILQFETEPYWTIRAKMEDWQELPLLKEKAHFFVEEVK